MANIIEAFNDVFTEEYALAKFFVYAIPVFICLNAYTTGQFVLSGICGFFVILLLFGLLTCGINSMRENKQEILTFNVQYLAMGTVKTAIAIIPQVSIAAMFGVFIQEIIPANEEMAQLPLIINLVLWSILTSLIITSYLAFTKHLDIKEAYNIKLILESVVDVFVNLVFVGVQLIIANAILLGMMSYVFTVLNLPLTHPGFIFYCSLLSIINLSVLANMLSQASYDCIKGNDEDYKDRYKIGTTINTSTFSGGIAITPSGAAPFTPGGITTSGSANNNPPPQSRAAQSRNHLNRRGLSGKNFSNRQPRTNMNGNTPAGRSGMPNRNGSTGGTINRGSTINRNNTPNRNLGGSGGTPGRTSGNAPKRAFGNNRRPGSGFGNNRNTSSNRFGNKKKNDGGFGGFFKK
jgi:hypothetical protein